MFLSLPRGRYIGSCVFDRDFFTRIKIQNQRDSSHMIMRLFFLPETLLATCPRDPLSHTLCSYLDRGTSGQRSVRDRVRPVMTISTPEARLEGRATEGLVGRLPLLALVLW